MPGVIRSSALVLIQFACIFLHELGHLCVAGSLGITTRATTLYCMGGVSLLSRIPANRWHLIMIAMGGPLVSFMIASALFFVAHVSFQQNNPIHDPGNQLLMSIALANMLLLFHNLAPAFPFDGGRILQMLLGIRFSRARAIQIPSWIGQGSAVLFGIITLVFNPALLLNAFGIFYGARQEAAGQRETSTQEQLSRIAA